MVLKLKRVSLAVLVALSILVGILCMDFFVKNASAENISDVMKVHPSLHINHPRRGHQLTALDGKLWVTGGKAYYSHFQYWGKEGYEDFSSYPNVECIDIKSGKVTYTDIKTGKDFYKATAFTVPNDSNCIYIAGKKELLKFDTGSMEITELKDPGEKTDWRESSWGIMDVAGKTYVVLAAEEEMCFFDVEAEKFVKLAGVHSEYPFLDEVEGGIGGCVINNKFYVFGGEMSGGKGSKQGWVFDPNNANGSQWSKIKDMPVGFKSPKVENINGKAYIIGGVNKGELYKAVIEYDPEKNIYTRKTNLPFETYKHDTAVLDNKVWISYGYSWGTEKEQKYGFRMHPPHIVSYSPVNDSNVIDAGNRQSVKGNKMNLNITWPDADKVTGISQTIAVNWTAATSSDKGYVYIREKGKSEFTPVEAKGLVYNQGLEEAKAYTAIIKDLKPSTTYEYYAVSEGADTIQSSINIYKTQPENAEEYNFVVYGDSKAQYDITNEINADILKTLNENLSSKGGWFMHLGDFGAYGAFKEWDAWFNYGYNENYATRELTSKYVIQPIHGNHEYLAPSWFNTFETPKAAMKGWPELNNKGNEEKWYSFNYGRTHFSVITTGEYTGEEWYDETQLKWLKEDLEYAKAQKQAGKLDWIIVSMHHPVYTTGDHFGDHEDYGLYNKDNSLKESYVDIIDKNGYVDIVFTAHDHNYERSKNIKGFRWDESKGYYPIENSYVEETSGRFGTSTAGKGTIWIVLGGAGAGQRDMNELADVGDYSWLAYRKPDPERGENAEEFPAFHYGVIAVSKDSIKIDVYEKDISYLPGWNGYDDSFNGLLDSVTLIKERNSDLKTYIVKPGDCLWRIGKKHGITVQELFEMNKNIIKNPDLIYPGQQLQMQ